MSYTLNLATGIVIRTADGVQVAPVSDQFDAGFLSYLAWVGQGNQPTEVSLPPPSASRKITKLAFRNRFTSTEKVSLEMASLDNPAATMQQRQLAAAIRVYLKDADNAKFIDLNRADTEAGVLQLAALGIVTTERAGQILNNPIQPEELWEA